MLRSKNITNITLFPALNMNPYAFLLLKEKGLEEAAKIGYRSIR